MFANVNHITLKPGKESDFQQIGDRVAEAMRQQTGFVGLLSLSEQERSNHLTIVTIWESAEAAGGWNQNNPVFARLREQEIQPVVEEWIIVPHDVSIAELKKDSA